MVGSRTPTVPPAAVDPAGQPDSESRPRSAALTVGGLLLIIFLVYTAFAGEQPVETQRGLPFLMAAVLTIVAKPLTPRRWPVLRYPARLLDVALIVGSIATIVYLIREQAGLELRLGLPTSADVVMAAIGVVVTFEMTRRTLGLALPLISGLFLLYALAGAALPFGIGHAAFGLDRVLMTTWYGSDGIFGAPLAVMISTIYLFLIFGALLKELGIAQSFLDLVYRGARRVGGGAGLATVGGSLAFGSVSGSGVADAAAVGTFTMPMMKRAGYSAETAAVIQGLSAIGAQLVPPVMGASAFVIAALVGVPYLEVAAIAIVPAFLYYLCVALLVHGRAEAENVKQVQLEQAAPLRRTLLDSALFVIVVAWLIFRLANDVSPQAAVAEGCGLTLAIGLLRKDTRPTPARLAVAVRDGTRGSLGLFAATGIVGVIVAMAGTTGVGNQVAELALRAAGGSLLLALLFTAVASIIIGTGLPTVAAYLLLAVLAAPALAELGVPLLVAHFFIFFYGVTSDLSPPTALAPVAAAGVAGADVQKTMWRTLQYGLPIFFIPFILVLRPGTMLVGSLDTIIFSILLAVIYVSAWAVGLGGYWRGRLSWPARVLLMVGGAGLLSRDNRILGVGLAVLAVGVAFEVSLRRRRRARQAQQGGPDPARLLTSPTGRQAE